MKDLLWTTQITYLIYGAAGHFARTSLIFLPMLGMEIIESAGARSQIQSKITLMNKFLETQIAS